MSPWPGDPADDEQHAQAWGLTVAQVREARAIYLTELEMQRPTSTYQPVRRGPLVTRRRRYRG